MMTAAGETRKLERLAGRLQRALRERQEKRPAEDPVIRRRASTLISAAGWGRRTAGRREAAEAAFERAGLCVVPDWLSPERNADEWVFIGFDCAAVEAAAAPRLERSPLARSLVGPAGELYVLYKLYLAGMLASLAPPRTPIVDVLVLSVDGETIAATLQVKARTYGADGGWHMGVKHEGIEEERMFYALVDFEPEHPATFVVPSRVVAEVLRRSHRAWMKLPGRGGRPHRDTAMRRLLPSYRFQVDGYPDGWIEPYREAWNLVKRRVDESA